MTNQIDFESIRHRVKLLQDTGNEQVFENRDSVECPVCGQAFTEALVTIERTCQLSPSPSVELCLVREYKRTIVFTHT
ncbi:flagella cluster protein [Halobacterium sp. KA-4]|uniref:DUF7385 family protein n=1 Tax=Halobacterium sp. KA-4 TaxID=2896367 RepID=UPI001E32FF7B|nr:flagella cluster protein [Halobacterium sp. KA-4]MCD2200449.1 flagella cluster protein [Halobacterium sp. KA-4]